MGLSGSRINFRINYFLSLAGSGVIILTPAGIPRDDRLMARLTGRSYFRHGMSEKALRQNQFTGPAVIRTQAAVTALFVVQRQRLFYPPRRARIFSKPALITIHRRNCIQKSKFLPGKPFLEGVVRIFFIKPISNPFFASIMFR